ncbi:hypothetical protein HKX48_004358 [Thoreauomyces humboldtii]|nr:hypothetical protein HKX48_004358 [Thoreauomyces humboldtii]
MTAANTNQHYEYSFEFDEESDSSRTGGPTLHAEALYDQDSYDSFPEHPEASRDLSEENYDDGSLESLTDVPGASKVPYNLDAQQESRFGLDDEDANSGDRRLLDDDYENESYESLPNNTSEARAAIGSTLSLLEKSHETADMDRYDDASYETLVRTTVPSQASLALESRGKSKSSMSGDSEARQSTSKLAEAPENRISPVTRCEDLGQPPGLATVVQVRKRSEANLQTMNMSDPVIPI